MPPPPLPRRSAQPPVSSKAKDYSMDRPTEVQNELDELRNRGLAKVLNRHFTDTTKKLAREKAAADAALADLERRRANTSEFVPSKGGELNPFDTLYVELQQKRAECRRKERETMLLYQRYVHKFGKVAPKPSVLVRTPPPTSSTTTPTTIDHRHDNDRNSLGYQGGSSDISPAMSTPEMAAPPPPSPIPMRPKLEPLDENSETTIEDDRDSGIHSGIHVSRFYSHQIINRNSNSNPNIPSRADPPTKSSSEDVPELEELTAQPSHDEQSCVLSSGIVSPSSDPPEQQDSLRQDTDESDTLLIRRNGTSQPPSPGKADPPTGPMPMARSVCPAFSLDDESESPEPAVQKGQEDQESVGKSKDVPFVKALFRGIDESVTSPTATQTIRKSATFAVDDESALVVTTITDRLDIGSEASDSLRPTREVTAATPNSDSEDDSDERSIISGLTISSHVTKQIMVEIEQEMTHFLTTETQAIRQLLDEEEDRTPESSSDANSGPSAIADESHAASVQAEALATEMQRILDEYKEESSTVTEEEVKPVTIPSAGYPKEYPTSDPTKHWMVYYDDKIQREYYYEKNSQVTQWEPPAVMKTAPIIMDPSSFAVDTSPRVSLRKTVSRRDVYRRRVRKQRMRRMAVVSALSLFAGGTVYHWKRNHAELTYQETMIETYHSASQIIGDTVDGALYALADSAESIKDVIDSLLDPKGVEDTEVTEQANDSLVETEVTIKKIEATDSIEEQEEDEVAEEPEIVPQVELPSEQECQKKEDPAEPNSTKVDVEETRKTTKEEPNQTSERKREKSRRPIGCFIPLASHIHPRCRKLAKSKPIFKEADVLNSFMQ